MTRQQIAPQSGIVVSTAIVAGTGNGGLATNHTEGIVVSTAIVAGTGNGGLATNHAEGVLVSTPLTAGSDAIASNHAESLVR